MIPQVILNTSVKHTSTDGCFLVTNVTSLHTRASTLCTVAPNSIFRCRPLMFFFFCFFCSIDLMYSLFACDHLRAPEYYIASVQNKCSWKAYPCSNYHDFLIGLCTNCNGKCPSMGYEADLTKKTGRHFLLTNARTPFCGLFFAFFICCIILSFLVSTLLAIVIQSLDYQIRITTSLLY